MVRMGRGSTLDLNTYFNSFYEQFWIERTTARSFSWQLHMRGYFNIKIFRERYNKLFSAKAGKNIGSSNGFFYCFS